MRRKLAVFVILCPKIGSAGGACWRSRSLVLLLSLVIEHLTSNSSWLGLRRCPLNEPQTKIDSNKISRKEHCRLIIDLVF